MDAVLAAMVLTAIVLVAGALFLWRRNRSGKQAALMLVLAAVIAANVAIWTLPGGGDTPPLQQVPR